MELDVSNESPHWIDAIEDFANGTPKRDPDVAAYLERLAGSVASSELRRLRNTALSIGGGTSVNRVVVSMHHMGASRTHLVGEVETAPSRPSREGHRSRSESPVATSHRWMWMILCLLSATWGIVAGASFFGGIGVAPSVALFGILGNIVLGLSLFRLGRAGQWSDR